MNTLQKCLVLCFFCLSTWADNVDSTITLDTLDHIHAEDSLPAPDIIHKVEENDKTKLIKRTFNHKQQIFLGIGMMVFIALIMTTAQSWNPKN